MPVDPITAAIVGSVISNVVSDVVSTPGPSAFVPAEGPPRTIPDDAVRGHMRVIDLTTAKINGNLMPMTPGVQIRDPFNRIVLPLQIQQQPLPVCYQTDVSGMVSKIWILSQQEAAQRR